MTRPAWFPQIALRCPTSRELAGAFLVVGLMAWAFRQGQHSAPIEVQDVAGPVRIVTVTKEAIAKAEPPAQPSLMHRAAYKAVQPSSVQVAPGAGRELLAAVCDTGNASLGAQSLQADSAIKGSSSNGSGPDTGHAVQNQTAPVNTTGEHPALAYAWSLSQPWTPWGAQRVRLFTVGRDGERIVDTDVHLPAEGRLSPKFVAREARLWRRLPKPLLYTAGVLATGVLVGRELR